VWEKVLAVTSILLSVAAFGFSVWTWSRSNAKARWDRWREKLSAAFRDDAREINRRAGKGPEEPLFVEAGPMTREFPSTAEVLSELPKSLREPWVSLLTEAITFAGSSGILWWEVHLYTTRNERWAKSVPEHHIFAKAPRV